MSPRGAWAAWAGFWAQKADGTPLALVRIALGSAVALDLILELQSGSAALIWGNVADTPEGFRAVHASWLFRQLGGADWATVRAVMLVTIGSALLLAAGVLPRLSAFVALQGCIAVYALDAYASGGYDRVATNGLWLIVLADSGRTLSLACRLRTGAWVDPTPTLAWPRHLIVLQLTIVYVTTGMQKLAPEWFFWGDLRAVHNMLLIPALARHDLAPILGWIVPLPQVATLLTWTWECTFWVVPLYLWLRPTPDAPPPGRLRAAFTRFDLRTGYVAVGVLFHLGVAALSNLGPFSAFCLALYPAFFTGGALRALPRRLLRRA